MPGRPRQDTVDEAILSATIELLRSTSFAQLSVEQIAKKAGVGKPAVYRRWPSKSAVVADALARFAPMPQFKPRGDPADSVRRGLVDFALAMLDSGIAHVVYSLLGEALTDSDLAQTLRTRYVTPRQEVVEAALQRCIDAGVLPPDLNRASAQSLLVGPLLHGWIVMGSRPDKAHMTHLVKTAWAAIAARTN
jgi:AcrR family transcriptional regulator